MRILLLSSVLLAGCAGSPNVPEVVKVPITVPCVTTAPDRPAFLSDADLAALDDYGLIVSLARERRLYQGYVGVLEATVAGCR